VSTSKQGQTQGAIASLAGIASPSESAREFVVAHWTGCQFRYSEGHLV